MYLENNLSTGKLTSTRLEVVKPLSSHTAISIEQSELLAECNRTLEYREAQRTLELQQEIAERRRAEEAAQAANRAKSLFLANMSHELRSPLHAILGFAQLMNNSDDLSLEQKDNLQVIIRNSEHLLTLINQVLDLSKVEAGCATLKEVKFNLYQLLDDLKEMFQLKANNKGLQLSFHRAKEVPQYVRCDEVKLRQVLINLLSNAVKFTSSGKVVLKVTVEENKLSTLHFEIADTGCGIAESELNSIFEAFVRTPAGQTLSEGTGLGLSIARSFVQVMGGDISVNSIVSSGSTFRFYLPVRVVKTPVFTNQQPTRRVVALAPNQPQYRILTVDDNRDNRQLLIKLLSPLNFKLQEATNAQDAIAIWKDWKPHLIFLDMEMRLSDSTETTRKIRRWEQQHNFSVPTKIIALSTKVLQQQQAVFLSAGCDDFICKPFQQEEIFEAIHKYLGARYLYDEFALSTTASNGVNVLTKAVLAALPRNLVANLHQAIIALDVDLIQNAIAQIYKFNQPIAVSIASLANNFQYEQLLGLTQILIENT
ncbi:ATP-binding response regulator [Scytonema sp. NUACC21]